MKAPGLLALVWLSWVASVMPALSAEASIETYSVQGATGLELYQSIGRNGPKGAIAQTRYKLTWKRLFDEEAGDCRLIRFEPQISISIILPKPSNRLDSAMQARWDRFIAGITRHEQVHVRLINDMTTVTINAVAGAEVKNDKSCAKVKAEVSRRIQQQMDNYKQGNRAFEKVEMSEGGNVHRLILDLVN